MKLNELKNHPGSTHRKKIENGQKSRSGASIKPWFEGGQNPLYKRIPRRGFNNSVFTKRYSVVNVKDLNRFEDGTTVTPELLKETGLVKKELSGIKVLGSGTLEKKLTVKANVFTNGAINKIESIGGKVEVI